MKNLVSHIATFLLGGAIAAGLLYWQSPSDSATIDEPLEKQISKTNDSFANLDKFENTDEQQIIDSQIRLIANLKKQIKTLNNQLNADRVNKKDDSKMQITEQIDNESELVTMNMHTFEESMKTQFSDQFKGVVLQLEGQRLEDIKRIFDDSTKKNEWSNQYENSIADFLASHDVNGDHYLQSLSCNTSVCRLEVNTNDSKSWSNLYAKMTNQSWYNSITIQEKSEYPGNVIYYLPSLNN